MIALLKEVSGNKLPLFKFIELYEKRYVKHCPAGYYDSENETTTKSSIFCEIMHLKSVSIKYALPLDFGL